MKNVTLLEFMTNLTSSLTSVTDGGDIVRVETEQHGAFVVMNEEQYQTMDEALKIVMAAVTLDESTYKAILSAAKKTGIK